jgi:hypothetical protein
MKMATGTVIDGKVVIEGVRFEEGTSVTVIARDDVQYTLSARQEEELLLSIAEADRGEGVPAEVVLRDLAMRHRGP